MSPVSTPTMNWVYCCQAGMSSPYRDCSPARCSAVASWARPTVPPPTAWILAKSPGANCSRVHVSSETTHRHKITRSTRRTTKVTTFMHYSVSRSAPLLFHPCSWWSALDGHVLVVGDLRGGPRDEAGDVVTDDQGAPGPGDRDGVGHFLADRGCFQVGLQPLVVVQDAHRLVGQVSEPDRVGIGSLAQFLAQHDGLFGAGHGLIGLEFLVCLPVLGRHAELHHVVRGEDVVHPVDHRRQAGEGAAVVTDGVLILVRLQARLTVDASLEDIDDRPGVEGIPPVVS